MLADTRTREVISFSKIHSVQLPHLIQPGSVVSRIDYVINPRHVLLELGLHTAAGSLTAVCVSAAEESTTRQWGRLRLAPGQAHT